MLCNVNVMAASTIPWFGTSATETKSMEPAPWGLARWYSIDGGDRLATSDSTVTAPERTWFKSRLIASMRSSSVTAPSGSLRMRKMSSASPLLRQGKTGSRE